MKKSQVTLSFNYLTAAIIIGVILIFGTISIIQLVNNVEKIESETFRKDFRASIERAGSSLHSIQYIELSGLGAFSKICFFDYSEKEVTAGKTLQILSDFPSIAGDLLETDDNIFLIKGETIEEKFSDTKIVTETGENGYVCVDITSRGTISLYLEGKGREVLLKVDT